MRPVKNSQELDKENPEPTPGTSLESESEKWAKSNLTWLSQSEYQRYLSLLEKETMADDYGNMIKQ